MDCGQKVARRLIVAGGNGSELLKFGEEILDQMPRLISVAVELPGLAAIGLEWDDPGFAGGGQRCQDALVGVVGLVGDQRLGLQVG